MKSFIVVVIILLSMLTISCKKSSSPSEPEEPRAPVSLAEYGSSIDEYYYKVWSDSTWECFNRTLTINGTFYATIMDCYGDEYYYSADGYAGFKLYGDSLILFDQPMPSLPDTINFNQKYVQAATFTYQDYKFTIQNEQTLSDTSSVSVSFGTFSCLWFNAKSTLISGDQSQITSSQLWMAQGPSTIKEVLDSGNTIFMTEGVVNGKGYGNSSPKIKLEKNNYKNDYIIKNSGKSLLNLVSMGIHFKFKI